MRHFRTLSTLALLLVLACLAASAATTMQTGQVVTIQIAGLDAGGNSATISTRACDISDHAKAYCVFDANWNLYVVSRGPLGNFTLTVTAQNSSAATIQTTENFTVVVGPASQLVMTIGSPGPVNISVPAMPAGW